jgi:membrane protease YdiL (CAAX protease family)
MVAAHNDCTPPSSQLRNDATGPRYAAGVVDGRAPWAAPHLPPPTGAPAGWYADPYGRPGLRYFDGRHWTGHVASTGAPAAHRQLPIVVAIGAVVVLLVSLIASRILLEHIVQFGWPIVVYVAINVAIGYGPSIWWCWYATGRWGSGSRRDDLGLRFRWSDLGWGPVVWLSAMVGEAVVATLITAFDVPLTSNTEGVGELRLDRTYVISILVTAVVAAPIVEETVFRGLMLPGLLSRMPWVAAVVVQGLLFGLAHIDPARGVGNIGLAMVLAAVGIVFGGAAYLLRRIGPTMLAHAILNAVVLTVVLLK